MGRSHDVGPSEEARANWYFNWPLERWLNQVKGDNAKAIENFLGNAVNRHRVMSAPGSRDAHHAWEGGYAEHVRQTMIIAYQNFELMKTIGLMEELPTEEQFDLSDALTVMFLHDIEKPFMYKMAPDGSVEKLKDMTKPERKSFRQDVIETYSFHITPTMENALKFVEGVGDNDYVPGKRADHPLASLCHAADNLSARAFYNFHGS